MADQAPAGLAPVEGRCLAVVLAAGEGTRMRSSRAKVLHEIAGRSMLGHVVAALKDANLSEIALVVGPGRDDVAAESGLRRCFVQGERRGTAHAVLAAASAIEDDWAQVLVAFADTPAVTPRTFDLMRRRLADTGAAVAVLGFEAADPTGYGRLLMEDEALLAIVEDKDASPAQRAVRLCNGGIMALDGRQALSLLRAIGCDNAQREFYLTDVVALARERGLGTAVVMVEEAEVQGVNDRAQLARAEATIQDRLRDAALKGGVTLVDPRSVTLAWDTVLARDVVVEPHVVFASGVTVAEGARIRSFSHLEGVRVGPRAVIGPFARLRPGAVLEDDVHVGNFVEVKASHLAAGVKVNHLSYIGDAEIGARSNVGAGTITCNYDGFGKHRTTIGADCFIGSHSSLVAPVAVGAGAFIATGSVITADVGADALAVARSRQIEKPGWAERFRDAGRARKALRQKS